MVFSVPTFICSEIAGKPCEPNLRIENAASCVLFFSNLKHQDKDWCCNPGGHLKKCRSPDQEKCRKSAWESAGPKRAAEESAEKLCSGSLAYVEVVLGDGTRSTFFGTFLGTPFRTGTFRSTFSALFLARASALL